MKLLRLEQGSDAWLDHRKRCITSTDAACIMGMNPWKSRKELLREKMGITPPQEVTDVMKEGAEMESKARDTYIVKNNCIVVPCVVAHDEHFWAIASLDGLEESQEFIVEIKCGVKAYEKALMGEIPPYYYAQMQHALWVTGCRVCHYYCYRDEMKPILIPVTRDDLFVARMVEEEKAFYQEMITLHPDDLEAKERDDDAMKAAIDKYIAAKQEKEKYEALEEEARKELIALCNDSDTVAFGHSISKTFVKGKINYENIPELKNVNLESYRNSGRFQWTIRSKK